MPKLLADAGLPADASSVFFTSGMAGFRVLKTPILLGAEAGFPASRPAAGSVLWLFGCWNCRWLLLLGGTWLPLSLLLGSCGGGLVVVICLLG